MHQRVDHDQLFTIDFTIPRNVNNREYEAIRQACIATRHPILTTDLTHCRIGDIVQDDVGNIRRKLKEIGLEITAVFVMNIK